MKYGWVVGGLGLLGWLSAAMPTVAADTPGSPRVGILNPPSLDAVRGPLLAWLGTQNPALVSQADAILAGPEPLLERVVAVVALGMPELRSLMHSWSDPAAVPPLTPPPLLRDERLPVIVRANLALWFAREMVQRRLYQEALDALLPVRAEQVVDPAAYYFYRAISENKLRQREAALASVSRLLSSVVEVPDRYRFVAELMRKDMETWRERDLGDIARRMQEIESRLHNYRGGPQTQERQKEVIALLDELIKNIEDQCNQSQCSGGSSGSNNRISSPLPDSRIVGGQPGKGEVDKKPLIKDEKVWGKMPEKEKVKALENVQRDLPPRFKEAIEAYTKRMAGGNNAPPRDEE